MPRMKFAKKDIKSGRWKTDNPTATKEKKGFDQADKPF